LPCYVQHVSSSAPQRIGTFYTLFYSYALPYNKDNPYIWKMESNTTKRIHEDLVASDIKGKDEYGVTVDRKDYTHEEWLQHAYEEVLDTAKYLRRALDTPGTSSSPHKQAVDILLEIDAGLNTEIGTDTTQAERMAFKKLSVLILERCKKIDPDRFAIPNPPQGVLATL